MSEESFFDYSQHIKKLPPVYSFTNYTPSFGSESIDKEEWFFPDQASVQRKNQFATAVKDEMSPMNLSKVLEFFKKLDSPKLIVEIGVMRNPGIPNTTLQFLQKKPDTCTYLGIDIEDRSYVYKHGKNIHILRMDSANTELIKKIIESFKCEIDFLFIDGLHSIYQVGKELDLITAVRKGGIIGFHDIAVHTGPNTWLDAMKPECFEIHKFHAPADWGVGFLVKKF
jgi:predicted O-methyltransferase YrrM